jgi:hypothetical protein
MQQQPINQFVVQPPQQYPPASANNNENKVN